MVKDLQVLLRYSPNHNERPSEPVSLIVMHYTGMRSGEEALEWLCSPESQVSAHYLVEENGDVFQLVEEDRRAWHAGVSHWHGHGNINDISIGIEIVNPGHEFGYRSFPESQMQAVLALSQDIMRRHEISTEGVVAHSDIAPLRKQDPGELFPWAWLAEHGVGLWHDLTDADTMDVTTITFDQQAEAQLQRWGHHIDNNDEKQVQAVIAAFQRRFRPKAISGIWDKGTQHCLEALLKKM